MEYNVASLSELVRRRPTALGATLATLLYGCAASPYHPLAIGLAAALAVLATCVLVATTVDDDLVELVAAIAVSVVAAAVLPNLFWHGLVLHALTIEFGA